MLILLILLLCDFNCCVLFLHKQSGEYFVQLLISSHQHRFAGHAAARNAPPVCCFLVDLPRPPVAPCSPVGGPGRPPHHLLGKKMRSSNQVRTGQAVGGRAPGRDRKKLALQVKVRRKNSKKNQEFKLEKRQPKMFKS